MVAEKLILEADIVIHEAHKRAAEYAEKLVEKRTAELAEKEKLAEKRVAELAEKEKLAEKRAVELAKEFAKELAKERAKELAEKEALEIAGGLLEMGMTVEQIAKVTKLPPGKIREINFAG